MTKKIPAYRQRPGYSQALVTLTDSRTKRRRDYWLGEFGTPESRECYHRIIAEWESRGRRLPPPISRQSGQATGLSLNEMVLAYWHFASSYYDKSTTGHLRTMIRIARGLYGSQPATAFGPNALRIIRDAMINGDPSATPPRRPWSRCYVNSQIHRLVRMFRWAASYEMIPAGVFEQLKTVSALRRGRSVAPETDPVGPVPIERVEAVRPRLSRQVRALVDLQLLTGARGGELFKLRPIDIQIDKRQGIWSVSLDQHKTAHRGHRRMIYFGPRAQEVLRPFMANRALDA